MWNALNDDIDIIEYQAKQSSYQCINIIYDVCNKLGNFCDVINVYHVFS